MDNQDSSFFEEIVRIRTQPPLPELEYYAISLLPGNNGKIEQICNTQWFGFTITRPRREIRGARLVDPERMLKLYEVMREPGVVVNNIKDLSIFYRFGGHCVIEVGLAKQFFPDLISPQEVLRDSTGMGYIMIDALSESQKQHAPSKKVRMMVLNRDKRRCVICGRSPYHYTDLELHVHHIIPWGEGGITEENNLITLCNTCHDGLDPHHDPSLRNYIISKGKEDNNYIDKIAGYHQLIHKALLVIEKGT